MRDPLYRPDVKREPAPTFVGVCLIAFGVGGSRATNSAGNALDDETLVRPPCRCRTRAGAQRPDGT